MDREELMKLVRKGPIRIRMNDGQVYDVPDREMILVDDLYAHVLYRAGDGKLRSVYLPLVTMSGIEEINALNPQISK